jgi:hypothetical protein
MRIRSIFRHEPCARIYRLFSVTRNIGTVGDGTGYSEQFTVGLRPQRFSFFREHGGWILTICGVRIHYKRSYGGIFC